MIICQQNLFFTWKLEKRVYNNKIKYKSNGLGKEILFNAKFIKIKKYCKSLNKFFKLFHILNLAKK